MAEKLHTPPPPSHSKGGPLVRAHIFISGRVQSVSFRGNTQKEAQKLGVTGWVRNLPDGRIEAILEGEKEKVEEMIKWAKRGPFWAKVNDFEVEWQEYQGEFNDFEIKYF